MKIKINAERISDLEFNLVPKNTNSIPTLDATCNIRVGDATGSMKITYDTFMKHRDLCTTVTGFDRGVLDVIVISFDSILDEYSALLPEKEAVLFDAVAKNMVERWKNSWSNSPEMKTIAEVLAKNGVEVLVTPMEEFITSMMNRIKEPHSFTLYMPTPKVSMRYKNFVVNVTLGSNSSREVTYVVEYPYKLSKRECLSYKSFISAARAFIKKVDDLLISAEREMKYKEKLKDERRQKLELIRSEIADDIISEVRVGYASDHRSYESTIYKVPLTEDGTNRGGVTIEKSYDGKYTIGEISGLSPDKLKRIISVLKDKNI